MIVTCPKMPTATRQKIAITLALLHQWQAQTLTWQDVQDIGKLTDDEMLALDPVEREDEEPALISKVMTALHHEAPPQPTLLPFNRS